MVRYGYGNCATCHVSPAGGGLVTNYGNSLSAEILSMVLEAEKNPVLPTWLNIGGDIRSLQTYRDTELVREADFFIMQSDLTVAVGNSRIWQLIGTVGLVQDQPRKTYPTRIDNRQYFLLVKPAENFAVRVGKFQKVFGINAPEHAIATKRGLGWDEGTETYNGEVSYIGSWFDTFLTYIDGTLEKGYAASSSLFLFNRHKLGASYFKGTDRKVWGFWMLNGWTESLFDQVEFDRTSANGEAWYCKEGWQVRKGVVLYLTQDLSKTQVASDTWDWQAYGLGIQLFPRSHYELNLQYQKRAAANEKFGDYAYAMMHIYL